jgi:hypothetical protein
VSPRPIVLCMKKDNRVRIRKDVNESLEYYMHEQMTPVSGVPGISMSKSEVVSEMLMNVLAAKGHYPVKVNKE